MVTILIVDDRSTNRELLVTLLGYAGYRLLEASDGEQGLAITRAEHPELIITDIVMPRMDGYEFTRQIRADAAIANTQIIFYTSSYIVEETRHLAQACGVSIVIGKPIEPELFLETIRAALDNNASPSILPVPDEFHDEHMRLLTDTLVKKVDDLEAEIVEHERAREALQRANDFAERLLQTANVIFLQLDTTGKVQRINPAAEEITGYTQSDVEGRDWFEILVPKDRYPYVWEEFDQIRQKGQLIEIFENPILTKRGEEKHILWKNNLLKESGKIIGTISFGIDITERKQAEHLLRESEKHFRQIIETAQEGIWTIDVSNRITLANQRLADMFGYTIDEMMGKSIYELMDEEGKAIAAKSLENRRQGVSGQLDFKYIRKNGSILWALMETSSLQDQNGNNSGVLAMLSDITRRKQVEGEIRHRLSELELLYQSGLAFSQLSSPKIIAQKMIDLLDKQMDWHHTAVRLFDPESQELELLAFHSPSPHSKPERSALEARFRKAITRSGQGLSGWVVQHGQALRLSDLKSDTRYIETFSGLQSGLYVPIKIVDRIMGVISIESERTEAFSESDERLTMTLAAQAAIAINNALLLGDLQHSNMELSLAYDATIEGWSGALDLRDKETEGHSQCVTNMTLRIAQIMGLSAEELVHIRRGALLHDIGKMGIPDQILLKPGSLTADEWVVMRKHPEFAFNLLSPIAYLKPALDIPYCHHEKWDGTGYPRGLKGEQIPLAARIFAVMDVWDALRSHRTYRAAWPAKKVREHIRSLSGSHFDPRIAVVCLESDIFAGDKQM